MLGERTNNLISRNILITNIIALLLLAACSKQSVTGYKLILVLDSAHKSQFVVGQQKSVRLAIEKFNAETNINGLALDLKILDLAKVNIRSVSALQSYINQLQRSTVLLGFVMGQAESLVLQQFQQILRDEDSVLLSIWPDGISQESLWLNIVQPLYKSNEYLLEYIVEERNLNTMYVVYDEEHRGMAEDFLSRSREAKLSDAVKLQYIEGRSAYDQGSIQSLAELLRNQKLTLQNTKQNNGIVLFLNQHNAEESNNYLAKSSYRYFFNKFDVILNNDRLRLSTLSNPQSPRYFVFQQREDEIQQQNYQKFQNQYSSSYHLRIRSKIVELYDAASLLAYTAKKTIESIERQENVSKLLYQNLLQAQFDGSTGRLVFDAQGQRLTDYMVFQWMDKTLEPLDILYTGIHNRK